MIFLKIIHRQRRSPSDIGREPVGFYIMKILVNDLIVVLLLFMALLYTVILNSLCKKKEIIVNVLSLSQKNVL